MKKSGVPFRNRKEFSGVIPKKNVLSGSKKKAKISLRKIQNNYI